MSDMADFADKALWAMARIVREYQSKCPGVKKACPSFDVRAWMREEGL